MFLWMGGVALACECAQGRLAPAEAHAQAADVVLAERIADAPGVVTFRVRESFVRKGRKPGEVFQLHHATDVSCGVSFETVGQVVLYLRADEGVYDACDLQSAVRHGNAYWWNGSRLLYPELLEALRTLRRTSRKRTSGDAPAPPEARDQGEQGEHPR